MLLLNVMGLNNCQRNNYNYYFYIKRGYFAALIIITFLVYALTQEVRLLAYSTYNGVLGLGYRIVCYLYLILYYLESIKNKSTYVKYLNAIGPTHIPHTTNIKRLMNYTLHAIYILSSYLEYLFIGPCNVIWHEMIIITTVITIIPFVLDYRYYILLQPLTRAYRSASCNIKLFIKSFRTKNHLAPHSVFHNFGTYKECDFTTGRKYSSNDWIEFRNVLEAKVYDLLRLSKLFRKVIYAQSSI